MSGETKLTHRPARTAVTREAGHHPYRKPILVARERLSRITAEIAKASGVSPA